SYPPGAKPNCHIVPGSGQVGDSVSFGGKHWTGTAGDVTLGGQPFGTFVLGPHPGNSGETLSGSGVVPNVPPGHYTAVFKSDSGATCTHPFEVRKTKSTSATLPFVTGGSLLGLAVLLFLGGMFIIRRRPESALKA